MSGKQKALRVNGVELPYVELGEGDAVVLVHGSNSDHRIWDEHREAIASRYRVIALTQRYFGKAPWTDAGENFSIQSHANDLAVFIQALGLGSVNLVGWSYGGAVCLTMAAQDPDLIKRMLLYEPTLATVLTAAADAETAYVDSVEMSLAAMKLADSGDLPGTVRRSMDDANAQEGAFDSLSPDVRHLMTDNARMLPLSFAGPPPPSVAADDLRRLQIPTTIALGAQSRSFYRIVTETVQSLLPNAEFELVESARHLWPVQDPPAFSRLVLKWLENG